MGEEGAEPSIGITSSGCIFFIAFEKVMRSCDFGQSWEEVTGPECSFTTSDLPGVTRSSIIELASSRGYEVREEKVDVEYAMEADECFCVGTAAVVSSIGKIEYGDRVSEYNGGEVGPVTRQLYEELTAIQQRRVPDEFGWIVVVE